MHPRDEWLLFVLGLFLFVIGANTQTGWLYVMDAGIIALMLLAWAVPRATVRSLRVHRDFAPTATEGDVVSVRVTVTNPGRWTRAMVTVSDTPVGVRSGAPSPRRFLLPEIRGQASVHVEYEMAVNDRGAWRFGEIEVRSASPVGFFPARRGVAPGGSQEIVVVPRGVELSHREGATGSPRAAASRASVNRIGHGYDFHGIREYQPGDDTRYVHWPTSARAGRLMVREFREVGAESMVVVVDTNGAGSEEGWRLLDHGARVAAGLVRQAGRWSAGLTLVAGQAGSERAQVRRNPRPQEALEWLARLEPQACASWPEVLVQAASSFPRVGTLFVVTADGEADLAVLRPLLGRCVRTVVYLLDPVSLLGPSSERELCGEPAVERLHECGMTVRIVRETIGDGSAAGPIQQGELAVPSTREAS